MLHVQIKEGIINQPVFLFVFSADLTDLAEADVAGEDGLPACCGDSARSSLSLL
jgi:hypothetical protein